MADICAYFIRTITMALELCRGPKPERSSKFKMVARSSYIPKDIEEKPLGEDAHFIRGKEQTIGVADGVGGWASRGVDAGEYARELMMNCVDVVLNQPKGAAKPKDVLKQAYCKTRAQGSSTACIITLRDNYIYAANVGDSGFMLFRQGTIVYRSPIQQRRFNEPYQLRKGDYMGRRIPVKKLKIAVLDGDILILGTDGLFDNMFATEIEEVLREGIKLRMRPSVLSHRIAQLAKDNSLKGSGPSPFSEAASLAGHKHEGGKKDDITVIVACIAAA